MEPHVTLDKLSVVDAQILLEERAHFSSGSQKNLHAGLDTVCKKDETSIGVAPVRYMEVAL